jgi:hypothetical protein
VSSTLNLLYYADTMSSLLPPPKAVYPDPEVAFTTVQLHAKNLLFSLRVSIIKFVSVIMLRETAPLDAEIGVLPLLLFLPVRPAASRLP